MQNTPKETRPDERRGSKGSEPPAGARRPRSLADDIPARHSKLGANLPGISLGGKDNYPADRDTVGQITPYLPNTREAHQINRIVVRQAVRGMVTGTGVSRLTGTGTGLPATENVRPGTCCWACPGPVNVRPDAHAGQLELRQAGG